MIKNKTKLLLSAILLCLPLLSVAKEPPWFAVDKSGDKPAATPKSDLPGLPVPDSSSSIGSPSIISPTSPGAPYVVDMGDEIDCNIDTYRPLVELLNGLTDKDSVEFRWHNYGGSVHSMQYIMNGILLTKAKTVSVVEAPTSSAGAILASLTNELRMKPMSSLMFHSGSVDSPSMNTADLIKATADIQREMKKALGFCVARHILTQEQADGILDGKDVYIYPEDLSKPKE